MKHPGWALTALLAAGPAMAGPPPPVEVIKAAYQFYLDAQPVAGDGEDPADFPPRLPVTPDAKTVTTWLKTGVLRPIKVTPFAKPDWLIDTARMEVGNYYCGTGGCEIEIWSQTPDTVTKIFDEQVRDYRFKWIGKTGRTWMIADFHGSLCGSFGAEACPWGFEWRDDGMGHPALLASWRFADGTVVHAGAPPQALDPLANSKVSAVPQVIQDVIASNQAACIGWGATGYASDGRVDRLPDLNGDGIDDWSYSGRYSECTFPEPADAPDGTADAQPEPVHLHDDPCASILPCDTRVWVSDRDVGAVMWIRAPLDPKRIFGLRHKGAKTKLLQLDNPPGVTADDDPAACDTYNITTCVLTPISLSLKP